MKKAVLFDLDNTLYSYDYAHGKALDAVYPVLKKEINISKKKFLELYKIANDEIKHELAGTASAHNRVLYFQRVVEKTHGTIEPRIILKMYETYWNKFLQNMKIGKGVVDTMKTLQKMKLKIALVTDLTTHIQLRKIEKLGLTKYVDYLVTSEEAGSEKPNAIMFLLALNKLGILASEAIMVGDNLIKDIEGANSARIDSVAITKENIKPDKEDYKKPNFVIKEIPEVLEILKKV